jgi:predicted PurR-regulated permease PerM
MAIPRPETAGVAETRLPRVGYPSMGYYLRITLTVIAVLLVLSMAWSVRDILLLVLVAAVLAVGLEPAVRRLQRMHFSRGWAVFAIFFGTVVFFVAFGFVVIPPLVREVRGLADNIPGYFRNLRTRSGFFGDLERKYHISQKLQTLVADLPKTASKSLGTILGITKSVASLVFNLLTIGILTIYFMLAAPKLHASIVALFPEEDREGNSKILDEALEKIGGYVSGNITISIIAGIAAFVALKLIGVPFAEALAMWVAIADLIPTVGATLGAVAAVLVAAFSSTGTAVVTAIYFIVYQQVENYVISPRIMAKAVDLSPAAVIVSVLIGNSLAGFAGALLALPMAAAAKVVVRDVLLGPRLAHLPAVRRGASAKPSPAPSPPAGAP